MKVLSQYFGWIIRLIAFFLLFLVAIRALVILNDHFGFWGIFFGLLTLPASVPICCLYDGFSTHQWGATLTFFILFPLLACLGGALIHWKSEE